MQNSFVNTKLLSKKYLTSLTSAFLLSTLMGNVNLAYADAGHNKMSIGSKGDPAEVSRTIEVNLFDNYYEPEELTIALGETVRFIVKNNGEFVHEFNIGTAAMHASHQEEMMTMMEHGMIEPDKINHDMMKMDMSSMSGMSGMSGMGNMGSMAHDDPNSILLDPGQSGEVIWKFSEKTDLQFACNIPGHYESGMMGPIHLKQD